MTDFSQTNWARPDFSQNYIEKADIYIVERRRMIEILKSFHRYFLEGRGVGRLLDLGCGDGIVSQELMKADRRLSATLVDGSEDMLLKARERLKEFEKKTFIKASFQELLVKDTLRPGFDLVYSSMAIHHLTMEQKRALFKRIHNWLNEGGYFVNIDVVLAPTGQLDTWYMKLWEEWMDEKKALLGLEDEPSGNIINRYKNLEENKPDMLEEQLCALKAMGFQEVDCFYKYGIFSIYGGRKNEDLSG